MHGEAEQAFRNMVEKRRKRKAASDKMKEQLQVISKLYSGHLNQLRGELADDEATMSELALNVKRKRSITGFIEEFNDFYNATLGTELAAKILPFGFTPEIAQNQLTGLRTYQTLRSQYEKIAGECQKLGIERDKAFRPLKRWMSALLATCKLAFADNLQTLEEIGFFVRNNPKPKKEEPAENNEDTGNTEGTGTSESGS